MLLSPKMEETSTNSNNANDDIRIRVHPKTSQPSMAWSELSVKQNLIKISKNKHMPLDTPIYDDKVRIYSCNNILSIG